MGKGIPYRNGEGFPDPTPWMAMNNINEMEQLKRRAQGAVSRRSGQIFEEMIERSLMWYEDEGLMVVKKTPEPMKPIRPMNKAGQFVACYTKAAQVDFSGTLSGGRAIRFEAKQTDTTRFTRDRLTQEQIEDLTAHEILGAYCCVMICFGFDHFYRIPWTIWLNMKAAFGRQYITEKDVEMFRLPYEGGVIKLLADTKEEKISETPLTPRDVIPPDRRLRW